MEQNNDSLSEGSEPSEEQIETVEQEENTPDDTTEVQSSPEEKLLREILEENPNAELRPQQLKMINLIKESISNDTPSLIQAGTGVGKSLGYLIPVAESGERAVICTATKQLSEQIVFKDLPTVAKAYNATHDKPLKFSLLKGRSNYLCLKKHNELLRLGEEQNVDNNNQMMSDLGAKVIDEKNESDDLKEEYAKMYEWADKTKTGDRSEAPDVSNKTWNGFSVDSDDCPGKVCPFYKDCFTEKAKHKAAVSDIIVTNHSLVAHSLLHGSDIVLSDRKIIIADEIHDLEKYLTEAWGAEVTPKGMLDYLALFTKDNRAEISTLTPVLVPLTENVQNFIEGINLYDETKALDSQEDIDLLEAGVKVADNLNDMRNRLEKLIASDSGTTNFVVDKGTPLYKRTNSLLERILMILNTNNIDIVQWVEKRVSRNGRKNIILKAAHLDLREMFPQMIKENEMTFIGTSATIKTGETFDSAVAEFGLQEIRYDGQVTAEDVGTPFNYDRQGLLFIPTKDNFPEPVGTSRVDHTEAVKEFSKEVLDLIKGRTLILCTTQKNANDLGEYLTDRTELNILVQGTKQAKTLVEEFKENATNSVLIATMGMWHGLDIPGNDLSLVLIDKIPFAPMDDILTKAKMDRVSKQGSNAFSEIYLRDAAINLTQGVGRLIRRSTDRGIVAILDPRINHKGYGKAIKASLPNLWLTSDKTVAIKSLANLAQELTTADIGETVTDAVKESEEKNEAIN